MEAISAGLCSLDMNGRVGDQLRQRLFGLVGEFRQLLLERGWALACGFFPVQAIEHPDAADIHDGLLKLGIRSLLQTIGRTKRVAFVLNANHKSEDLSQLANALDRIVKGCQGLNEHSRIETGW